MASKPLPVKESLEKTAETFLSSYIRQHKTEVIPIQVIGVDHRHRSIRADAADVHAFLKTLDQDEGIRFDVTDAEAADELIYAEPETETVDIDLDLDQAAMVLAKKVRTFYQYFTGINSRKRLLWSTDIRLAKVFESDTEIIETVFQFKEDGDAVLRESFSHLNLHLLPAPAQPEF